MTDMLTTLMARTNRLMEELRPMMRDPEVKNKTLIRDTLIHLDAVSSFLASENYKRLATLERIRKENLELIIEEDNLGPHKFTAETVKKLRHSYDTNEDDSSVG